MTAVNCCPRRFRRHNVEVRVASGFDDMMRMVAVRAAVYLAEQNCPYDEEFDGNDFTATHIIALADGEPAGCIRLRYFGDFVKYERVTIRREFRSSNVSDELIRFSLDFIRRKGFRTVYGHAAKNLIRYWRRWGFRPADETIRFSGLEFVPVVLHLPEGGDALSLESGHMRLNRPEGAWDRPGILDASSKRGAAAEPTAAVGIDRAA